MACKDVPDKMLNRRNVSLSGRFTQSVMFTWLNVAWSGGQSHGTRIGFPSAPFIAPSQLPVPEESTIVGVSKNASIRTKGPLSPYQLGSCLR